MKGNKQLLWPRWQVIYVINYVEFVDPQMMNMINVVVFENIVTIPSIDINHNFITTLMEMWRMKTHTFHLPHWESTITLEFVTLHLGLPIDGQPLTGFTSDDLVPTTPLSYRGSTICQITYSLINWKCVGLKHINK